MTLTRPFPNIGTSVTNTVVAMTQVNDKDTFRRAFSGATVHDMFNWSAVVVLLTLEIITFEANVFTYIDAETNKTISQGFMEFLAGKCANGLVGSSAPDVDILKVITEPVTLYIIQVMTQARVTSRPGNRAVRFSDSQ